MRKLARKLASMNYCVPPDHDAPWEQWRDQLRSNFSIIPVVGVELEWYLYTHEGIPASDTQRASYIHAWNAATTTMLVEERGHGQVEATLMHRRDLHALIAEEATIRAFAQQLAPSHELNACFRAKPSPNHYGSGMHIHLHLENLHGASLFEKNGDALSPALRDSLAGLLYHMREDMDVFTGSEVAKARYVPHYDAPTTVSWGGNNRTVALRLPDGVGHLTGHEALRLHPPSSHRRIEHRVASSEANLAEVLRVMLRAIFWGLTHHYPLIPPSYGNAHQNNCALL